MHHRRTAISAAVMLATATLVALALAACGSSGRSGGSGDPKTLLGDTFSGNHKVNSGKLDARLVLDPSGSTTLTGPITLSFGGPFQNRGAGKLPASNFTLGVSALGASFSLGILSTGTSGYVSLQGTSYRLPQATFRQLESSFARVGVSSPGAGSGSLAKLGIHPLTWLHNPRIVGTENVGGAQTTHIHAGVNVGPLLNDLSTLLRNASSLGVSGTGGLRSGLSAATRSKIAAAIHSPSVDVWTGTADKILRRLTIGLTVPVTGSTSTALGGMRSAHIELTLGYDDVNKPQTVTPPTTVRPFSEFQAKLSSLLQTLQGAAGGALGGNSGSGSSGAGSSGAGSSQGGGSSSGGSGGGSSSGNSGSGSSGVSGSSSGGSAGGSGTSTNVQKYGQCIQAAGSDVTKMQKCASLLGSGG